MQYFTYLEIVDANPLSRRRFVVPARFIMVRRLAFLSPCRALTLLSLSDSYTFHQACGQQRSSGRHQASVSAPSSCLPRALADLSLDSQRPGGISSTSET